MPQKKKKQITKVKANAIAKEVIKQAQKMAMKKPQKGGAASDTLANFAALGFQTGNPKAGAYAAGGALALKALGFGAAGKESAQYPNSSGRGGVRM